MTSLTLSLDQLADQYLNHLIVEKGLAAKTVEAYACDLTTFLTFLKDQHIEDVTQADTAAILKYVIDLRKSGRSGRTRARHLVTLRGFYNYLHRTGILKSNPAKLIDMPKSGLKLPEVLDVEQVSRLLGAPDRQTPAGLRDAAMLELIYAAGLRVSELINLKVATVNLEAGFVRVMGKGSKERIVPIGRKAIHGIQAYIASGRPQQTPHPYLVQYPRLQRRGEEQKTYPRSGLTERQPLVKGKQADNQCPQPQPKTDPEPGAVRPAPIPQHGAAHQEQNPHQ